MLFMVIERFKNGDARPVYEGYRDKGRLTPDGLSYVSSWVDTKLTRCYQLMETDDPILIHHWIASWSEMTDFEVIPVLTPKEAADAVARMTAALGGCAPAAGSQDERH